MNNPDTATITIDSDLTAEEADARAEEANARAEEADARAEEARCARALYRSGDDVSSAIPLAIKTRLAEAKARASEFIARESTYKAHVAGVKAGDIMMKIRITVAEDLAATKGWADNGKIARFKEQDEFARIFDKLTCSNTFNEYNDDGDYCQDEYEEARADYLKAYAAAKAWPDNYEASDDYAKVRAAYKEAFIISIAAKTRLDTAKARTAAITSANHKKACAVAKAKADYQEAVAIARAEIAGNYADNHVMAFSKLRSFYNSALTEQEKACAAAKAWADNNVSSAIPLAIKTHVAKAKAHVVISKIRITVAEEFAAYHAWASGDDG